METTRSIVPRADGEGSLGTTAKKWGSVYANNGIIAGRNIAQDGAKLDAQGTAIEQIRVSVGTPLVANIVSDMTDKSKIYVYTGNQTGYTKGNWYYWNGSAWVSGGVYNSTAFETDKTLTIEGAAADAKAAGDWLRDIAVPVTALPEIPETAFADEYMKVVVDSEKHVLYGVRRDGSFYWQKGVPAHLIDKIHEIAEPTIDNDEYLYVMLDTEGHIILGIKRDGTFTWQKGVPKPIVNAIEKNIDNTLTTPGKSAEAKVTGDWLRDIGSNTQNSEYIYCMTDSEQRVLFGVRVDGSVVWPKGTPAHVVAEISNKLQKDSLHNSANIFKKVCCCGDSYTEGYIVKGDGTRIVDNSYSWPHYIETMTGNKWVNCGVSGATVLSWQTDERGLAKATSEGLVQAYMIGLGLNDCWRELPVGTYSDIGTEAETYYGGMSAIVSKLHQISSSAKIFLFTMPEHGEAYIPYNNAVRDIVKYYRDNNLSVHCIDLQENQALFEIPQIISDRKGGHYTAIGYACFAKIIFNLLSEYIDGHVSEFQDVAFIEYSNS
jgi:hypothetical protein